MNDEDKKRQALRDMNKAHERGDIDEATKAARLYLALCGRDDTRLEAEKYDFDAEDAKNNRRKLKKWNPQASKT